jgi:hypothetical protein
MKSYAELACDNLDLVQSEIYTFLINDTELLTNGEKNWQFLDTKKLVANSPNLVKFFLANRLYIQQASVTLLYEDLSLHLDELPMVAKVNIPIRNTKGWVNRWYELSEEEIAKLPKMKNQFGSEQENVGLLIEKELKLTAELHDLDTPIVFHSRIPHSVIKLTPEVLPRIVASFTFINQPVHLLK